MADEDKGGEARDDARMERQAAALEALRRLLLAGLVGGGVLLAFLALQGLWAARDVRLTTENLAQVSAQLTALGQQAARLETAPDKLEALRAELSRFEARLEIRLETMGDAAAEPPPALAPAGWTGVYISELAPLLPLLAEHRADMGEVWIFSRDEALLARIAETLEALQAGGLSIDIEENQ